MSDEIWTPVSEIPAAWRPSFERAVRQLDMPFRAGYYYRYWIEEEDDAQILAACQKLTEMHYASNGSFNSLGDFDAHRWIADRRRQKRILAHEHRDFDLMLALNAFGGLFAEEFLSHLNYELSLLEFDTGERNAKGQLPSIVASNIEFCYHRARKLGCPLIEAAEHSAGAFISHQVEEVKADEPAYPGRPPMSREWIAAKMRERGEKGELCTTLKEEAGVLLDLLAKSEPSADRPTPKTIRNIHGALFRSLKQLRPK